MALGPRANDLPSGNKYVKPSSIIVEPNGTHRSQKLFTSITSVIKTTVATGQIGLGESRFAYVTVCSNLHSSRPVDSDRC